METKQKINVFPLIAGAVFVLLALRQVVYLFRHFSVVGLLYIAMEGLMAAVLIAQKRDILLLVATSFLTLLKLYALAQAGPFRFILLHILELLPVLALLALTILMTTNVAVQYREKGKQIWFVPIILSGVFFLFSVVIGLFSRINGNFFLSLLSAAGYALAAIWVACPEGMSKEINIRDMTRATVTVEGVNGEFVGGTIPSAQKTAVGGNRDEGYMDMAACVLLLLFTCGIYLYVWIYRTTKFLNRAAEEQRDPLAQLLLCMFIPFYYIYWVYKSAQRIDAITRANGGASDSATFCLILAVFAPIVAPMIMQDKINHIAEAPQGQGTGTATYGADTYAPAQPELGAAAELKTYKELLDSGAITQEEFDRKKKQLLDE